MWFHIYIFLLFSYFIMVCFNVKGDTAICFEYASQLKPFISPVAEAVREPITAPAITRRISNIVFFINYVLLSVYCPVEPKPPAFLSVSSSSLTSQICGIMTWVITSCAILISFVTTKSSFP